MIGVLDRPDTPVDLQPLKDSLLRMQSRIQEGVRDKSASAKQLKLINSVAAAAVVSVCLRAGNLAVAPKQPACSGSAGALPVPAQFAVILLLSRKRRDDVLNDLWDWHPGWAAHHGLLAANFLCYVKIASAAVYEALDLLCRVAEIVSKFRGAK
jgi:hypothetical protein